MSFADAADAWLILLIVVSSVLASEGLTFLTVYRRDSYKRACDRVVDLSKRFDKEEAKIVPVDKRKAHDRNVLRLEEDVKEATAAMSRMKLGSNISTSIAFFLLYRVVANQFSGRAVAELPFEPFAILKSLTHRGLDAEAPVTACGFGFIYTLATMALKQNVPRLFGFAPPRSAFDPMRAAKRAQAREEMNES